MGSGDSGAAAGPSNSAINIPASTSSAPTFDRPSNRSPITRYEVITANTGSSVKIIAAWLEVVYCCAHSCVENAIAVANTAQITMAAPSSHRHANLATCHPVAEAAAVATQASAAHAPTCNTLNAATECFRV